MVLAIDAELRRRGSLLKTANVRPVAARVSEDVVRGHRGGIRGPEGRTSLARDRVTADQSLELAPDRLLARTELPFAAVPMRRVTPSPGLPSRGSTTCFLESRSGTRISFASVGTLFPPFQ